MKILNQKLFILCCQPEYECGIVRLIGQRAEFCFFVASQVFGNLHPDIGTGVSINARLMEAGSLVPYLAACVWDQVRLVIMLDQCV